MASTTVIAAGVHSDFAIRSLMSIVVTHIVTPVVHHSCALVVHWSILARQASFGRAVMVTHVVVAHAWV